MDQRLERFYNTLLSALTRAFSKWYLDGDTLAYFMCNYSLQGCRRVIISAKGNLDVFTNLISRMGFIGTGRGTYSSSSGIEIEIRLKNDIGDILKEYPKDWERYPFCFPTKIGEKLDYNDINWTEKTKRMKYDSVPGEFFTPQRKKNGYELLGKMLECGKNAGIDQYMFLAFGNLLGYALRHDFMPKDNDLDMCILGEFITQEQCHQYLVECKNAGLMENRMRGPVSINGKYTWFSIGDKSITNECGVKACNWFWFKHGGYWWHSKGMQWIGRDNLSKEHPTAKGISESIFTGEFRDIEFGGHKIKAPIYIGKCLDWWYNDWLHRRGGSSAINTVLIMPDENDKKTWYIENKK